LNHLTTEHARRILHAVSPELTLISISLVRAAFTNEVQILECRTPSGNDLRLVVKLLTDDPSDAVQRASADYYGLKIARAHGIPAPEPLYLDTTGGVLGVPGIVTRMVEGKQIAAPDNVTEWAETLADFLLTIHDVTLNADERKHVYDCNDLGLYFLTGDYPERMSGHPLSDTIYDAIRELRYDIEKLPAVFIHMDYWPGNLLWSNGKISAALDWDASGYGDPALDVAYFRMNMYLRGIREAADIFLDRYEAQSGVRVRNLGFWELARAAGPLPNPARWIPTSREMGDATSTDDRADTDYYEFVESARRTADDGV
jgi:aminoglycoside phosphotransferase (APT) family kinase protein